MSAHGMSAPSRERVITAGAQPMPQNQFSHAGTGPDARLGTGPPALA